MRTAIVTLLSLALGVGAALAQSAPIPPGPTTGTISKTPAESRTPAVAKSTTAEGVAECMKLWDAGTHMSKAEWSATCKRVQSRLENLKINSTMGLPKTERKKSGG
jgi:hypothetical protein